MKILILLDASDPVLRAVTRFAATHLAARGHEVALIEAGRDRLDGVEAAEAVLLAGRAEPAAGTPLARVARGLKTLLRNTPTLYLAIRVAEPGGTCTDRARRAGFNGFFREIGWRPQQTRQIRVRRADRQEGVLRALARRLGAGGGHDAAAAAPDLDYAGLAGALDAWLDPMAPRRRPVFDRAG